MVFQEDQHYFSFLFFPQDNKSTFIYLLVNMLKFIRGTAFYRFLSRKVALEFGTNRPLFP